VKIIYFETSEEVFSAKQLSEQGCKKYDTGFTERMGSATVSVV